MKFKKVQKKLKYSPTKDQRKIKRFKRNIRKKGTEQKCRCGKIMNWQEQYYLGCCCECEERYEIQHMYD